jgi:uncharacterized protein YcbX
MSNGTQRTVGTVVSLWRYPVKSMMGEELNAVEITSGGALGDRAFALVDEADGKLVSAKNPRKWPQLFDFRSAFIGTPRVGESMPPVLITLPDGRAVSSDQDDAAQIVSDVLGRQVRLSTRPPEKPALEEYWPDIDGLNHRDTVTDEEIPSGAFFDGAVIHLLTTAALDSLRQAYPQGRFEVRRFRPNIVVAPSSNETGFAENSWIGKKIAIGEGVRIEVSRPCPRCVMTTLAQGDLPNDTGILRTAAQENEANVGVYCRVVQEGIVRRGDPVTLEG